MRNAKTIKKILFKLVLYLSPFLLLIISFVTMDPFMIFKKYTHYNEALVNLNADVVSTEMYLHNRKQFHYNSFIFGNSRCIAYKVPEWKKYLDKSVHPFVFMAFNESLYGLLSKIKFVDAHKDSIKNALFIIDDMLLTQTENYNDFHLYIKDPKVSGESKLQFYNCFFKAYLSDFFFIKCMDYSIFRKKRKYMNKAFDTECLYFDPITNDLYHMAKITARRMDSAAFYKKFRAKVPVMSCSLKTDKQVVFLQQEKMLREIKQILDKQASHFKIIISPKYECYAMDSRDKKKLVDIFGKENIYDFSGVNKYTTDIHSFYEPFHYTIETGNSILKEVYTSSYK